MLHHTKRIPTRERSTSNIQFKRGYTAVAVSRSFQDAAGILTPEIHIRDEASTSALQVLRVFLCALRSCLCPRC
jgi:hypothetical protein